MSENSSYDPSAPEGSTPVSSQYMSKRDVKLLLIISVPLILMLIPVYLYMREKAYKSTCIKNINGIMEAITLYSAQHDDRYPPAFADNGNGEPTLDADGYPYTWVSDVWSLKSDRVDFVCPTASKEEWAYSASPTGGAPIPSTYGFYAAYSSYSTQLVDNPDSVIILAETSNGGSHDTFDPHPFSNTKYDGYVIGWDNSNTWPDQNTKSVTRLAFPGSRHGGTDKAEGRHDLMIYGINANRQREVLNPNNMLTDYNPSKFLLTGHWQEPLKSKKK